MFQRYRRRTTTGVFDAMLETLADVLERDGSADMIDSTVVRAHHCATGMKKGLKRQRALADRGAASRPSSTPAVIQGLPVAWFNSLRSAGVCRLGGQTAGAARLADVEVEPLIHSDRRP